VTIEKFLAILGKRWWLVLLCCLTAGAGAYIGSRHMTPLYQSAALIQIAVRSSNNQGDYYTSLLASEQLVQTEATLATSDPVLREVASHYPGLTAEQLSGEVTAAPKLNTQLFEIDVQNSSPTRAATLANDVAVTLIKQQAQAFRQNALQSDVYLLIVQPAQPGLSPVRPNKLLNTGEGLLVGFLLGMLFAVFLELLDTRVRTPEVLTELLGWPVVATIWRARSHEEVFNPKGNNANLEAYRILRTNIGFSTIDKPVHTLMVTSVTTREGKSAVAANLAIFMAKAGKNTLLIDANLRRPVLSDLFGIPGGRMGLSSAILAFSMPAAANASANDKFRTPTISVPPSSMPPATQRSLDPFIHAVNIPNLWVMPSGPLPPNPSELLDSKAMQHLLKALSSCGAEVVIFDTSPLLGLSDASILASKVDGTLVVVDITRARKESLKQGKAPLVQAGTCVLGCVVNKQRRSRKDAIYSYFYSAEEQDEEENHSTNNLNSAGVPADILDANDLPVKLPRGDSEQGE
jgi:tyrosine-protein kinase